MSDRLEGPFTGEGQRMSDRAPRVFTRAQQDLEQEQDAIDPLAPEEGA